MPISMLAARIERFVDRPVLNETELSGQSFDVELEWAPEVAPTNSDKPGLSTALVEQLGLKLEATKGTAEVLVIDSVEQPTPD